MTKEEIETAQGEVARATDKILEAVKSECTSTQSATSACIQSLGACLGSQAYRRGFTREDTAAFVMQMSEHLLRVSLDAYDQLDSSTLALLFKRGPMQ